ncbi:MAG: DNA alkylation repair protein [Ignavibacteriales bacterium]|nr:DNA alkylation repair protein [Ignavibacteriales bacterium]
MTVKQILSRLKFLGDPKNVAGMARYGIVAKDAFGVSAPDLRLIAKEIGYHHELARKLWSTEILDARILAAFIDDPKLVTEKQMEAWVKDFDNWAICDGICIHLFRKTPYAWKKAKEWSKRKEEFVKRAGFTLFATLAVHDKHADDKKFIQLLPIIKRESTDERNGVKKAVNWALRQIGKRNLALNKAAIQTAKEIKKTDSPAARWIASNALRELMSDAVRKRLLNNVSQK